jgi:hypothetical protein
MVGLRLPAAARDAQQGFANPIVIKKAQRNPHRMTRGEQWLE